jgi:hypothetical protein
MSAEREGGGAPLSPVAEPGSEAVFELATLSDVGTDRPENEDSCGHWIEHQSSAMFAVADGVGGYEGGEIASKMAIETTLEDYREVNVRGTQRLGPCVGEVGNFIGSWSTRPPCRCSSGDPPSGCNAPCSGPISRFIIAR